MKRLFPLWLVAVTGCGACARSAAVAAPSTLEDVLPRSAVALVVVPDTAGLGQKLKALEAFKVTSFAAQLQGFGDGHEWAGALAEALGIDPRSEEALKAQGLEPHRASGLAAFRDGRVLLALPVADEAKFQAFATRFAAARLGAPLVSSETLSGLSVRAFSRKEAAAGASSEPVLMYALRGGYALLAARQPRALLSSVCQMVASDSLAADRAFAAARAERLPKTPDLLAYLPQGLPPTWGVPAANITIAARLDAEALVVDADIPWQGEEALLLSLAAQPDAGVMATRLPADAFAWGRTTADASLLSAALKLFAPRALPTLKERGLDVETLLLAHLKPGAAFSFSLSRGIKLGQGMPALDARKTNPFAFAQLSGALEASDDASVKAAFDVLRKVAPSLGAQIRDEKIAGVPVNFTTYSQGEGVHFASAKNVVALGSPADRVVAALAAPKPDAGVPPLLLREPGQRPVAVAVDLVALADAVRALPASAWGVGGFAMKATANRWLEATDDLKSVVLGVGPQGRSVSLSLRVGLGGRAP